MQDYLVGFNKNGLFQEATRIEERKSWNVSSKISYSQAKMPDLPPIATIQPTGKNEASYDRHLKFLGEDCTNLRSNKEVIHFHAYIKLDVAII